METKKQVALKLPGNVVYYNKWTNFESKKIRELFECIPYTDAAKLQKGTTIWIDDEQPNGKVYGYSYAEIISVENYDECVSISYKGPYIVGGATVEKKSGWHKVHRCKDDAELVELIRSLPLAIEIGTVASISDTSRQYLESIGAVIVPA